MVSYLQAQLEDRTLYFELDQAQLYQESPPAIPIHWEENGQVFFGEIELKDLETLEWDLDVKPEPEESAIVDLVPLCFCGWDKSCPKHG